MMFCFGGLCMYIILQCGCHVMIWCKSGAEWAFRQARAFLILGSPFPPTVITGLPYDYLILIIAIEII